jgi:hypothetical protein
MVTQVILCDCARVQQSRDPLMHPVRGRRVRSGGGAAVDALEAADRS